MEFLNHTTLAEIVDQRVAVVVQCDGPQMDMTFCKAFLQNGTLFIDCIPKHSGKYVVKVPDDATISRAVAENPPAPFLIIISPESEAAKFIKAIVDFKNSWN